MANFGNNFITVYSRTASEDIAHPSEIITGWSTGLGNPSGFALSVSFTAISTLSEWAQLGMAALLVGGGLLAMRKRSALD
ncbi:MAG: IPTL-CTERM sorting domain-containing protein [candidate division NC10 bacterium]|nr:IPTL-CTERM sorting domain-containing protein [candidate division NC10 bacterium]MDE2485605.1 IPTL-CTERM sorting domain-containing protein [candidate division NC10 bacterium]